MYLTVFVRAAVIIQSCLFTLNYYLIYSIKSCYQTCLTGVDLAQS